MMKNEALSIKVTIISVVAGITMLSGCSTMKDMGAELSNNYYSKQMPTLESINASKNKTQSYMGVAFYTSDFKDGGQPKTLHDYDFLTEDAPCTVLGEAYQGQIGQDEFYSVQVKDRKEVLVFNCRYQSDRSTANRLFLMGTFYECEKRTWGYEFSVLPEMKRYAAMCAKGHVTDANKSVSALYEKFTKSI